MDENNKKFFGIGLSLIWIITAVCITATTLATNTDKPVSWDVSYTEDIREFEEYNASSKFAERANIAVEYKTTSSEVFAPTEDFMSVTKKMSDDVQVLVNMTDSQVWSLLSDGVFTEYPNVPYKTIKNEIVRIQKENTELINVRCWYWEEPTVDSNMDKVTVYKTFAVHKVVANLYRKVFEDIYSDPTQPIINIGDGGMGTWVTRGKNHNDNNTLSAHSIGVAIDINPSSGSFNLNGTWYGNAYKHKAMPTNMWSELPESHKKYHVLYEDSPIVRIFKSYGFIWGGDWVSGTDSMHFSFLGDGGNARDVGRANYNKYN